MTFIKNLLYEFINLFYIFVLSKTQSTNCIFWKCPYIILQCDIFQYLRHFHNHRLNKSHELLIIHGLTMINHNVVQKDEKRLQARAYRYYTQYVITRTKLIAFSSNENRFYIWYFKN